MSGPATDPPVPAENSDHPATANATAWSDTVMVQPPGWDDEPLPPSSFESALDKAPVATEQLSTIGFIGRYALKYQIGEGGLGRVYAAHDPLLSRLIAIKTLHLEISPEESEAFNAMFLNEARAAGGLSHPNIVTVFDAGVSEQGPYIAMELLRGRDLRQLRLEGWKPTPTQAALIIRRVSDALGYAHSKGVVHRDIKPANIFMVGRTQPRVLDFGIARIAHQHDQPGEETLLGGSPYYMAPEQVRHSSVDKRCDVFSLGVVLYELLTDSRPFRGNSLSEITDAVLDHQPTAPHELDPNVPKALSDIAMKAMEKHPDARYSSARSLSRELRHWLEENAQNGGEDGPAPGTRGKWIKGIASGAAAVAVAAGVAWYTSWHQPERSVPPHVASTEEAPSPELAPAPSPATPREVPSLSMTPLPPVETRSVPRSSTVPDSAAVPPAAVTTTAPIAPAVKAAPAPAPAAAPTPKPAPPAVERPVAPQAKAPAEARPVKEVKPAKEAKEAKEPKETAKERRLREAREKREARLAAAATAAVPVAVSMGVVRMAVSPWGQVEVDGRAIGIAPPLNELNLPEGRHTITIRNDAYPPFSTTVNVTAGQPVNLKHRFGS